MAGAALEGNPPGDAELVICGIVTFPEEPGPHPDVVAAEP